MTMSLSNAPVDVARSNTSNGFYPPSKMTDSVHSNSSSCCSSNAGGRQQIRIASELLFKSAAKHRHDHVTQHPGRDTQGTVDILEAALGVACDGGCDLDDSSSSSSAEDYDVAVKFTSASPSDDYYGSRKMSRPSKSVTTRKRPTTEKREFLLDDMQSFQDMLNKACQEEAGDDHSCCETSHSTGDFEDEEKSYVSFVDEWDVPVNFSKQATSTSYLHHELPGGAGKEAKREIMLDNLQSFQAMLDEQRDRDDDDESYSSSEEEEEDFELCLY
mmetsp:Transcript_48634/g.73993  ORF Transcript_48634/g.73993 Transcript_48634/m.73993 type:complete len:273 (-) Transcript_48634:67-885(-)